MIDGGAQPKQEDINGMTPLHRASCYGAKEVVEILLERGAVPDMKDGLGKTPLDIAKEFFYNGQGDVIQLLRQGTTNKKIKVTNINMFTISSCLCKKDKKA